MRWLGNNKNKNQESIKKSSNLSRLRNNKNEGLYLSSSEEELVCKKCGHPVAESRHIRFTVKLPRKMGGKNIDVDWNYLKCKMCQANFCMNCCCIINNPEKMIKTATCICPVCGKQFSL